MKQRAKVYIPVKKVEDYIPYFTYEEDEKIEDCAYLLRDVKITIDSNLARLTIQAIEDQFAYLDSEFREYLKSQGLEFKYVLHDNQTESYELVMNDKAKEYIEKAVLNIAILEGKFEEMVLVVANGGIYANVDAFESLDQESKDFLKTLLDKKLIKKKTIKVNQQSVPLKDIISIG